MEEASILGTRQHARCGGIQQSLPRDGEGRHGCTWACNTAAGAAEDCIVSDRGCEHVGLCTRSPDCTTAGAWATCRAREGMQVRRYAHVQRAHWLCHLEEAPSPPPHTHTHHTHIYHAPVRLLKVLHRLERVRALRLQRPIRV